MNEYQMRDRAKGMYSICLNDQHIRVRIAVLKESEAEDTCCKTFKEWAVRNPQVQVEIIRTGSFGYDDLEPIVMIDKPGKPTVLYRNVTESIATRLIESYLESNDPCKDLAFAVLADRSYEGIPAAFGLPLFSMQKRIAMRHCGLIDPENIDQYIAEFEGYSGLAKTLTMSISEVNAIMDRSGLRERSGHGCAIHTQWGNFQKAPASEKIVICNAFDNDPEARAGRLLLEGDPHAVLEGLLIAAYAIGASQAIVAFPAGYGSMKQLLDKAVTQMKDYNLIGANILESGFDCDIKIKEVPMAMIAGEKTALIRFLEGRQPIPVLRNKENPTPELCNKPVLINNIETLANVSAVMQDPDCLEGIGTTDSIGTKIVTLTGAVAHPYTVEIPFGTSIDTVIRGIGGGVADSGRIKAVQFGSPTASYLKPDHLSKKISYETAREVGADMGFGVIEVITDNTCAVELTEKQMLLLHGQSCGKCVFCREGTLHMADLLSDIRKGEGTVKDIELLSELGNKMLVGCVCSFGLTAAKPVLSALELFPEDFEAHLKQKICLANLS
ncbi:hypothetical protein LPY66_08975 [Dehalobacter sp. DCM]|uniref:NADH-ubiquinone oxidoreductase-F iron-sulfur binding region domain-containing protein n=1 Tax=Dehalobacter sp. DCM TaxID=2907827 RepID=UPI0030815946|nr:hypothetical protein LPY66_08975 [Dehalobacter sp. DCM]